MRYTRLFFLFFLLFGVASLAAAETMEEALTKAALDLKKTKIIDHAERSMIIQVVNLHSKQSDLVAQKIETLLYQSLEKAFPKFKLVFLSESVLGINLNKAIFIRGTYEPKGAETTVNLLAVEGMAGEAFGQASVTFETEKTVKKTLVAVLDIEADFLNAGQKQALSEIFRGALAAANLFEMASSADVSKMDADAIQKSYSCTRDECAAIIGEQLGVDRSISTSIIQFTKGEYVLSSKILDIKDGSIIDTQTLSFEGTISGLKGALSRLADQLTGHKFTKPEATSKIIKPEATSKIAKLRVVRKQENSGPSWVWHLSASSMSLLGYLRSKTAVASYNSLSDKNKFLSDQYAQSTNVNERTRLKKQFDANQTTMAQNKTQTNTYNRVTALGGLWELWLLYDSLTADSVATREIPQNAEPLVQFRPLPGHSGGSVNLAWRF